MADLLLPGGCAGCGDAGPRLRYGVCQACAALVAGLHPHPVRPDPAPAGLPLCAALGGYHGVLRELVLAYKDHGRHRLGGPLGRLLARAVASLVEGPAVLVPVPDTPAAARARHGDHMRRLARSAAAALRDVGMPVSVAAPVRARPRPDSAGLDTPQRLAIAYASVRARRLPMATLRHRVAGTGPAVVLLDDVVTTGATLTAVTSRLVAAGIPVTGAAVLAATRRTHPPAR